MCTQELGTGRKFVAWAENILSEYFLSSEILNREGTRRSARRNVKCHSKRTAAFREARQQHRLQASSSAEPDELAEKFFQGQYPEEGAANGEEMSLPDILGRMEGAAEQAEPAVCHSA